MAIYLAARRLAAGRSGVLVLTAATASSVGLLVYSATVTSSLRSTLEAKVHTFVGSDLAVDLRDDVPIPLHWPMWEPRCGAFSV